MKKILIILSVLITILVYNKELNKVTIPNNSIRIRIIANSNNIEDQILKLKVKDKVENILYKRLNNIKDINQARLIINNSIEEVDKDISNITDKYTINYGYNYFPNKNLYGVNYEEGKYESLVINLGKAKGNNWWCVLFPPLCLLDMNNNKSEKVEYKSKVLEILKEYK